jgi:hypothetical protein
MEYLNNLGSMVINEARCTRKIRCSTAIAKAVFDGKETLFTRNVDVNLRKKVVKCHI